MPHLPAFIAPSRFTDADAALEQVRTIYQSSLAHLRESMQRKYVYNFDWLGRPIIQYPQDMWAVQDLIWRVRPDLVIETGIAHGGSLVQDLPAAGRGLVHREQPGQFTEHSATFDSGVLASVYGTGPVVVNSSHHQAVDSAGSLRVTGRAVDGTIETCEDPDADFCVGVQWHPEHPDRREVDRPLLQAFAAAAERYCAAR